MDWIKLIGLFVAVPAAALLVIIELLDWKGRLDLIEQNFPKIYALMNNRAVRALLLIVMISLLARDFRDISAIAPPPVLKFPPPQAPDMGLVKSLLDEITALSRSPRPTPAPSENNAPSRNAVNRTAIAAMLEQGNAIKRLSENLTERPELITMAEKWATDSLAALRKIDAGYAAMFTDPPGFTFTRFLSGTKLPTTNNNVWNFVNRRTEALTKMLERMPQ